MECLSRHVRFFCMSLDCGERFVADILAAPRSPPTDFLDSRISVEFGLADCTSQSSHTQHATAVGQYLTIGDCRSSVKYLDVFQGICVVDSADFVALVVAAGITLACHDYASAGTFIPLQC